MAQQPLNNVVRTTMQGLAAVLGGTQSLHTNSYDEAIGLPTEQAATLALRTQQIIAYESGVASSADPLAGSYLIEALTDELEAQAKLIIADIDAMGGAVTAIEAGWVQAAIADAAYAYQRNIESHEQVIVGLNKFTDRSDAPIPVFRPDEGVGAEQIASITRVRATRDEPAVQAALADIARVAHGTDNLLHPMRAALALNATVGEVCGVLRGIWGEYRPTVKV
jgi:methylmalonyl-CoA mutase N-terminal domain/subunit